MSLLAEEAVMEEEAGFFLGQWWGGRTRLRQFLRQASVLASFAWLLLVIVCAIFAPFVAPHDPNAQNLITPSAPPSAAHWFGTDDLGRDVLSRLIYGARISMQVPFETVAIALVAALLIGLVAGYRGGRVDYLLMRATDAGLSFPPLVLALAIVAVLGSNVNDVALALAFVFAPGFARFIRGQTLAIKEEAFVEASASIGTPPIRIVLVRVFPNVLTGLVVQIAIALGAALLAESALSFLGLGPPPPAASWGSMLQEAYNTSLFTHPWSLVPPGLAIAITVLAFNTLGDALRDTLSGSTTAKFRRRGVKRQRGLTVVDREGPTVTARPADKAPRETPLLEVCDLTIEFQTDAGPVRVVEDVSFEVAAGRIVGLVGESGCGKTVSSLSVLRLLPSPPARIVGGSIRFEGRDLLEADFEDMRKIRGQDIAMVFQDPLASLDPSFTIGTQLIETIRLHERLSRAAARDRAARLLESVHIPDPSQRLSAYPHQLSGGMRQRVMIAMALSCHPRLLIADEPTTALDVTVQAQIVELLYELRETEDLAVLFVTHDLALISELSDEIAVMYAGQVVEQAPTQQLFAAPASSLYGRPPRRYPRRPGARRRTDARCGPGAAGGRLPRRLPFPPTLFVRRGTVSSRDDPHRNQRGRPSVPVPTSGGACPPRGRPTGRGPARPRRGRAAVSTLLPLRGCETGLTDALVAELVGVSCHFNVRVPGRGKATVHAVEGVDLAVARGKTIALVGESGSGKSTVARLMLRLVPATAGLVRLGGEDITAVKGSRLRVMRRRMQLVFQDPYSSFDPLATIGSSITEALRVHTQLARPARERRTAELLDQVRLPAAFAQRRPREVSGGQLQRAAIARALATEPELLALDEPLSSLDVATQVQIIDLLEELQEHLGIAYLFISHDLNLVRLLSDEVAVMYLGQIVETGSVEEIFEHPQHPYTKALLSASPSMDPAGRSQRIVLRGDIPSPLDPPSGCPFRTRCSFAMDMCASRVPADTWIGTHRVRCHLMEGLAPTSR